jgi:anti-sigma regulatory factor (Ser/Thr protein kinase)
MGQPLFESKITCGSESLDIGAFSRDVELALRRTALDEERLQGFLMAVDEAITNIAMYACRGKPAVSAYAIVRDLGASVEVELVDEGPVFDPTAHKPLAVDVPLEDRQPGGMGVALMRRLCDALEYRRVAGENHFVLTKNKKGWRKWPPNLQS